MGDEINAGHDELSQWAKNQTEGFFLKPDANMAAVFPTVSQWASSQNYEAVAINTFMQVADYYLVYHALGHGFIVVTHEVPANSKKRIKIPNVCVGLGIKFKSPYEMLRHEQAKFVLGAG